MCPFAGRNGSSICSTPWNLNLLKSRLVMLITYRTTNPPRKSKSIGHVTNQDVFLATSLGIVLKAQTISTCKLSSESRQGSWSQRMGILETLQKPGGCWTQKDPTFGQKHKKLKSWNHGNHWNHGTHWNHGNHVFHLYIKWNHDRKQSTRNIGIPFGRSRPCFFLSWFTG